MRKKYTKASMRASVSNVTQSKMTSYRLIRTPTCDVTGEYLLRYQMMEQTHIFNTNLQKELLSEYKHNSKNKSQEYAKFLAEKKALITILVGRCDEPTKTKITLLVLLVHMLKILQQMKTPQILAEELV